MRDKVWRRIRIVVTCGLCWLAATDASAQFRKGFTQQLTEVPLKRRRPPRVYLTKTVIDVRVTAQAGRSDVAARLGDGIQSELLSNDRRLRPSKTNPEIVVQCQVNHLAAEHTTQTRKKTSQEQVGTKKVFNAKKGVEEDKPIFKTVSEVETVVTGAGSLSVSYQARDEATGKVLDSDTIHSTYRKEFSALGSPLPVSGIEQALIEMAVRQIVPRLTATTELITVALARPTDAVDALNKLGQSGLWSRMVEQLESMPALTDAKEAYRRYNIGVAYEALGYETEEIASSRKFLEHASIQYAKALELKPDEKYFREPQARISSALAAYKTLEDQTAESERQSAEPPPRQTDGGAGARGMLEPRDADRPLDNALVIELAGGGLDEANLIATIDGAPIVKFDLSPVGLKDLLAKKVPNRVIAAMRAKQQPSKPPAIRKPMPAKKGPPAITKGTR